MLPQLPHGVIFDPSSSSLLFSCFTGHLPLSLITALVQIPESQPSQPQMASSSTAPASNAQPTPPKLAKPSSLSAPSPKAIQGPSIGAPEPRWGCTATPIGSNRVLVYGGEDNTEQPLSDVYALSCDQWERVVGGDGPARSWHSAVYSAVSNCVIVYGGRSAEGESEDVQAFDCELNYWYPMAASGKGPGPRQGHSAVLLGETMLVFGGSRRRVWYNDVHALDTRTLRWTALEDLPGRPPAPRAYHSAVALGQDRMLVFGGNSADCAFGDVHILRLGAGWQALDLAPGPLPRCGACLVALPRGDVALAGGWDSLSPQEVVVFADAWRLRDAQWAELQADDLGPLTGAAAWAEGEDVVIFGGQGPPPANARSNRVLRLAVKEEQRLGDAVPAARRDGETRPPSKKARSLDEDVVREQALATCQELGFNPKVAAKSAEAYLKQAKKRGATPDVESCVAHVVEALDGPANGLR